MPKTNTLIFKITMVKVNDLSVVSMFSFLCSLLERNKHLNLLFVVQVTDPTLLLYNLFSRHFRYHRLFTITTVLHIITLDVYNSMTELHWFIFQSCSFYIGQLFNAGEPKCTKAIFQPKLSRKTMPVANIHHNIFPSKKRDL